jgi:hypothetical protein
MIRSRCVVVALSATIVVLFGLAVTGCAATPPAKVAKPAAAPSEVGSVSPDETGAVESKTPTPDKAVGAPLAAGTPKPGLTKNADGTAKVVGTLQLREIEGDIWVIADSVPSPGAARAKVLVVVSNPELFDMSSLNGYYVVADGTLGTGAATSKAGPQMIVNAIEKIGYAK